MADIVTFNSSMHQNHLLSITLCKYPSLTFPCSSHFLTFSPPKHAPFLEFRAHVSNTRTPNLRANKEISGRNKTVGSVVEERIEKNHGKGRNTRKDLSYGKNNKAVNGEMEKSMRKNGGNDVKKERIVKKSKRKKDEPLGMNIRMELDQCCKKGDVMAALQLYDLAHKKGIEMAQYHYTLLLYLCSSAAAGVVHPAKSGRSARTLGSLEVSNEASSTNVVDFSELVDKCDRNLSFVQANSQMFSNLNKLIDSGRNPESKDQTKMNSGTRCDDGNEIVVSEDIKKYALERGFELYEKMCKDNIPTNEATLTSVARMAMSMGYGDMAFGMVKQMEALGINPRLRSYAPALSVFCNSGDVDKAFAVEQHMLKHGVCPEEPELEALLRVSVEAGKGDKVYYLLHKLRNIVRKVSPSTASVIVGWFKSKAASRVGKTKWDKNVVQEAIENGGGGWHGQGWLGKGKWTVSCTSIGADAFCKSCGEKLATIDLDPKETDNFAESVASIAIKREKDSSFQRFQKWLDYYGPFEALIDGANVGLISQSKFTPSKINAVANGIRQKLPSKKWPLIVLHNKRVTGPKMNEPVNKSLVEKWKNADALYATPTGSNDDWYWLYAAIKFKCLLVTNDEMRDHTFQLLGNDFFPKWKERHQVHFDFNDTGPVFHMPPCFSVVIQESENGHWHIPITTDHNNEQERAWLCIRRTKSAAATQDTMTTEPEDSQSVDNSNQRVRLTEKTRFKAKKDALNKGSHEDTLNRRVYKNLKNILSASGFAESPTLVSEIEAAEKLGDCVIDFQI